MYNKKCQRSICIILMNIDRTMHYWYKNYFINILKNTNIHWPIIAVGTAGTLLLFLVFRHREIRTEKFD